MLLFYVYASKKILYSLNSISIALFVIHCVFVCMCGWLLLIQINYELGRRNYKKQFLYNHHQFRNLISSHFSIQFVFLKHKGRERGKNQMQ